MTAAPAAAAPRRGRRPPRLLAALSAVVVGAAMLPLAYLLVRAIGADEEARAAVRLEPTLRLVVDTVLLVVGVVTVTLVLGTGARLARRAHRPSRPPRVGRAR